MKLLTNGATYAVTTVPTIHADTVRIPLDAAPASLGDTVELTADDNLHLRTWTTAEFLRHYIDGNSIVLTQIPEPEPVEPTPAPEPNDPIGDLEEVVAELTDRVVNLEIGGN